KSDGMCNIQCIKNVVYDISENREEGHGRIMGLKIKGTDILLGDIMSQLEDDDVYDYLSKHFCSLKREEIEAALRMITMLLIAFEKPSRI
ncbi:MAG: hypothetical protein ETSY2_26120, partial [Candidatus Entotheonella gemina]